jgi:two-component system, NtrC family, response regulator AtoC
MPRALIVDDHEPTLAALAQLVDGEGYTTARSASVADARSQLDAAKFDVLLVDLNLPDGSGLQLLEDARNAGTSAVVLITGQASVASAVAALRNGVTDYLTKPLDFDRLRVILSEVARSAGLADEIQVLKDGLLETGHFGSLVGRSASMRQVYDLIARVAPSSATVFLSGESGSGKELVARMLHDLSRRRAAAFVAVNCGAISPTLMESELFGHERGSFTGADRRHRGLFERAHGGTLFLDEVTELPLELQVKLLRVLETGTFTRTGGEVPIEVDARIIAATNRQLDQAVAKSSLREDLFYRLKVFHIPVPPLRERVEDIEVLGTHFLGMLAEKEGRRKQLSPDALEAMRRYAWPGNVRELRNALYTAYLLADGDRIDARALPAEIESGTAINFDRSSVQIPVGTTLAEAERRVILTTLARYEGNKPKTAEVLGVSLKTLYNRLHEYGYWADREGGAS